MSGLSGIPVLVTGGGGFIGSHLVETLVTEGASVRTTVRYNSRGDRGSLESVDDDVISDVEIVAGDLRDSDWIAEAIHGREVVFHLAAQIAIPYSYVNPRDFFETNVIGSLNVAQACRAAGTRHLVHTSSSEVYGTAVQLPITEEHPLSAQSPYAASKVGADQMMLSFHRSYELPVTVLRPFNTYGPRQSARAVIPTIIGQALRGETVRLGSLDPRRDLLFVEDTVSGFTAVAQADEVAGETLQLGTERDVSVGDLVDAVGELLGRELVVEQDSKRVRPADSEVMRLVASPARMSAATGWRAQTSLEEGLAATVRWMESHLDAYALDEYVI